MIANPRTARPEPTEYGPYFGRYVSLPPDGDIVLFLESQLTELKALLGGVSERDSLVRHAPYTWSIKQVVGHVSDCERVFGYRALWIARNNPTPLSPFDENDFMRAADFDRWPFAELLAEFEAVHRSQLFLFEHLDPEAWLRRGLVGEHSTTVRAIAHVMGGHAKHHLDILHKRGGRG
jgi:DinB family protein